MNVLATTIPGVEATAAGEIEDLLGVPAQQHHRGAIAFEASPGAIGYLNSWARSIHRVLIELGTATVDSLAEIYTESATLPIEQYVAPGQSFGVRATRHGDHSFTSVDVADRVGQAIVDRTRETFGERLPVDLDGPDVIVRVYLRHDNLTVTIDTTGADSLHKRGWRVCDHHAPLRPTLASIMLRLVDLSPDDRVLDPMCGGGTLPIEAALWQQGRPPQKEDRTYAYQRLTVEGLDARPAPERPSASEVDNLGIDKNEKWVRCANANVTAGEVDSAVTIEQGDATTTLPPADIIATDLPFGIRTSEDLPGLYAQFADALAASQWDRFVGLTTRPDLLPISPTETIGIKYGQLDATIIIKNR